MQDLSSISGAAMVISDSFFQEKPVLLFLDSLDLPCMEHTRSPIFGPQFGLSWDLKNQ